MIRNHYYLLKQLVKRDISLRYKGSYLGIIWSFITPLFMLCVYTFVFTVVFQAKWNIDTNNKLDFAFIIFSGITAFNLFAESINRAPTLMLSNISYVKKVVFPLEILPLSTVVSALVNAGISFIILITGLIFFGGGISWKIIFLPLVILPIMLLSLGISWILASLGVFLRDLGQLVAILTTALMYLSPIFYSIESVPVSLKPLLYLNPVSYSIENIRNILIFGKYPDFQMLLVAFVINSIIAFIGYVWFKKTKGGFADVL